jgi:hypothetical protein
VVVIQERLVDRQQTLAEAQGQIAQGLIQVYRALGGGWQIRCEGMDGPTGPGHVPDQGPAPVKGAAAPEPVTDKPVIKPSGLSEAAEKAHPTSGR